MSFVPTTAVYHVNDDTNRFHVLLCIGLSASRYANNALDYLPPEIYASLYSLSGLCCTKLHFTTTVGHKRLVESMTASTHCFRILCTMCVGCCIAGLVAKSQRMHQIS